MATAKDISRKSLRRDQVLEVHFMPWPEPPPNMLKLPGVAEWWNGMKLARERDTQALHRLINNLGIASGTDS